jgi:hypothetical protein
MKEIAEKEKKRLTGSRHKISNQYLQYTVKKTIFPSPVGMSLTKLSLWAGIIKLFPSRESLISDIPARDRKMVNLFLKGTVGRGGGGRSNTPPQNTINFPPPDLFTNTY